MARLSFDSDRLISRLSFDRVRLISRLSFDRLDVHAFIRSPVPDQMVYFSVIIDHRVHSIRPPLNSSSTQFVLHSIRPPLNSSSTQFVLHRSTRRQLDQKTNNRARSA